MGDPGAIMHTFCQDRESSEPVRPTSIDEPKPLSPDDSAATVLVVEDDEGNRLLVRRVLEDAGHFVVEADDGPTALRTLATSNADLVVLDLGLPGQDGLEVLSRIRDAAEIPVLVLTARSAETERVTGLDAGADDYMVKPYSVAELAARVRALLRRSTALSPPRQIEIRGLRIDLEAHRIFVKTDAVDFTPKEFAIIAFLAEHSPRTFSRDALLEHVWGSMSQWQDRATVTEHVRRVRVKLATAGCASDLIETVRGYGYRIPQDT